jgi:hypothetical protein
MNQPRFPDDAPTYCSLATRQQRGVFRSASIGARRLSQTSSQVGINKPNRFPLRKLLRHLKTQAFRIVGRTASAKRTNVKGWRGRIFGSHPTIVACLLLARTVHFTDVEGYFVSEASIYRLLKAHDLICRRVQRIRPPRQTRARQGPCWRRGGQGWRGPAISCE